MNQAEPLLVARSPRGYLRHAVTRHESTTLRAYWLRPLCVRTGVVADLICTREPWLPTVPDACPRCVRAWWRPAMEAA
jgi:hypothetical protein